MGERQNAKLAVASLAGVCHSSVSGRLAPEPQDCTYNPGITRPVYGFLNANEDTVRRETVMHRI
jgi:hypothetical protein